MNEAETDVLLAERDDLFPCQECDMWVSPAERHTIDDCFAFIDRESFESDDRAGDCHDG